MSYEYAGTLHRTYQSAVRALCHDWLTAMSIHDARTALELTPLSDVDQTATDMVTDGWNTIVDTDDREEVEVGHADLVDGIKEVLEQLEEEALTSEMAAVGLEVTEGAYTGTSDDIAGRWYIEQIDADVVDRRGGGYESRLAALREAERGKAEVVAE